LTEINFFKFILKIALIFIAIVLKIVNLPVIFITRNRRIYVDFINHIKGYIRKHRILILHKEGIKRS